MAKKSEARLGKGLAAIFGEDVSEVLEDIQQGKAIRMSADALRSRSTKCVLIRISRARALMRRACRNWHNPSASMAYLRRSWSRNRWAAMS